MSIVKHIHFEDAQAINDQAGAIVRQAQSLCLACCHEGSSVLCVSGRLFEVRKNEAIIIAPHVPYLLQASPNNLAIWTFIDIDVEACLGSHIPSAARLPVEDLAGPHFPHVLRQETHGELLKNIQQLIVACRLQEPEAQLSMHVRKIAMQGKRLSGMQSATNRLDAESMFKVLQAIFQHYRSSTGAEMCDRISFAQAEAQRLAEQHFACTLDVLIDRVRIYHAAAALSQGGHDLTRLHGQLGLQDQAQLEHLCLQYFNCRPQVWQQLH